VPSFGTRLNDDPAKVAAEWAYTAQVLQLAAPPVIDPTVLAPQPALPAVRKPQGAVRDMAL
jgi:malate dehydrogenase (quinone)